MFCSLQPHYVISKNREGIFHDHHSPDRQQHIHRPILSGRTSRLLLHRRCWQKAFAGHRLF
ncbi:hypothetical protein EVA_17198 [gut metagenome]|uniref:Uncharacterized protein n=1 Tax=gut metagenome TaxID=749906 RepID=J9FIH1_9ZZZZ